MAKKQPWGAAYAVIQSTQEGQNSRFLRLGAVWETENGNLSATLELEPIAWKDPAYARRIVFSRRNDEESGQPRRDGSRGRDRGNDDTSNRSNKR